ncbi:MAG TPA: hypothetical protein VH740_14350 [Vicinamibacterales bacterium]
MHSTSDADFADLADHADLIRVIRVIRGIRVTECNGKATASAIAGRGTRLEL